MRQDMEIKGLRIVQPGIRVRQVRFEGKFNASKVKSLMVLASDEYEWTKNQKGWLTTRQLVWLTGLPYSSLSKLLPKWAKWQYVHQRKSHLVNSFRIVNIYHIAEKGELYLMKHDGCIPFDRYAAEMEAERLAKGYL